MIRVGRGTSFYPGTSGGAVNPSGNTENRWFRQRARIPPHGARHCVEHRLFEHAPLRDAPDAHRLIVAGTRTASSKGSVDPPVMPIIVRSGVSAHTASAGSGPPPGDDAKPRSATAVRSMTMRVAEHSGCRGFDEALTMLHGTLQRSIFLFRTQYTAGGRVRLPAYGSLTSGRLGSGLGTSTPRSTSRGGAWMGPTESDGGLFRRRGGGRCRERATHRRAKFA